MTHSPTLNESRAVRVSSWKRKSMIESVLRDRIFGLHHKGVTPYDIANRYGLLVGDVKTLLRASGFEIEDPVPPSPVHRMWDMSDDDRRREIAQRAARGARAALQSFPHPDPSKSGL